MITLILAPDRKEAQMPQDADSIPTADKPAASEKTYTVGEVAALANRSEDTVYRLIRNERLVSYQPYAGCEHRIPQASMLKVFPYIRI